MIHGYRLIYCSPSRDPTISGCPLGSPIDVLFLKFLLKFLVVNLECNCSFRGTVEWFSVSIQHRHSLQQVHAWLPWAAHRFWFSLIQDSLPTLLDLLWHWHFWRDGPSVLIAPPLITGWVFNFHGKTLSYVLWYSCHHIPPRSTAGQSSRKEEEEEEGEERRRNRRRNTFGQ